MGIVHMRPAVHGDETTGDEDGQQTDGDHYGKAGPLGNAFVRVAIPH
ncbi:MAG: hypothetical protein WAT61_15170 [Flavobacteriales bacterium]|jgi:hypothetical protein|nr:hypothetical protein [Flavobacteriales bacterium]MBP9159815.1 hypothetical protein [Flavobacteriales bacterium]